MGEKQNQTNRTLRSGANKSQSLENISAVSRDASRIEYEDNDPSNSTDTSSETIVATPPTTIKKKKNKNEVPVSDPLRFVPATNEQSDIGNIIKRMNKFIEDLKTNIGIIETNLANVGHSAKRVVVDAMRSGLVEMNKQINAVSIEKEQLLVKVIEATRPVAPIKNKPLFTEIVNATKSPQCNLLVQVDTTDTENGMDCVQHLKEKVGLPDLGAGVSKVKSIGRNKILITTSSKKSKEKIENKIKEVNGVRTVDIKAPKLSIILKFVHSTTHLEHVPTLLYKQNEKISDAYTTHEEFTKAIRYKRQIQRDNSKTKNVILGVEPKLYDHLMRLGRVHIGWQEIRVDNFIDVTRCYKCQSYGHIARHCTLEAPITVCSFCAEAHKPSDCPIKQEKSKHACHNCLKIPAIGKLTKTPHNSLSSLCPVYLHAKRNQELKVQHYIDHGTN